jgi:hypothetical protein
MTTFKLPDTAREADSLADELGALATATEWQRAALIYSRVIVQEGQARPTGKKVKRDLLTPAEYALRGIHGLRSKTTVRGYWRAWDNAITEGLAQPVKLGDEVELPDAEWSDYYHITRDCPPWANTAPETSQPRFQGGGVNVDHVTLRRRPDDDGLGLGDCGTRFAGT